MDLDGSGMLALGFLGMAALTVVLPIFGCIAIRRARYNREMHDVARSVGGWPVAMRIDVPATYIVEAPSDDSPHERPETPLWIVSKGEVARISTDEVWTLGQERLLRWYVGSDVEGGAGGESIMFGIARSQPGAHPQILADYNIRQMRLAVLAIALFIVLVVLMALVADDLGMPHTRDLMVGTPVALVSD